MVKYCIKIIHSWKLPVKTIIGVWINDRWEVEVISQ
jgi:hypothetical protein